MPLIMTEDIAIDASLETSKKLSDWVAVHLNGLKIPELPNNKRLQLAMACLHLVIEHGQAIIHLVDNKFYGSALALQRPMFEGIVRGVWLRYSATDEEVDKAGNGKFLTAEEMVRSSPRLEEQEDTPPLKEIKEKCWKRFCDYTHGGLEQIRARLNSVGLQDNYSSEDIMVALHWSDITQLYCGVEMASAACNLSLAQEFLSHIRNYGELSDI